MIAERMERPRERLRLGCLSKTMREKTMRYRLQYAQELAGRDKIEKIVCMEKLCEIPLDQLEVECKRLRSVHISNIYEEQERVILDGEKKGAHCIAKHS